MKSILRVAVFTLIGFVLSGTIDAQIVIYDNFTPTGGNTNFGGGTGFPASRALIGDNIDSLALANLGDSYLLNDVDFSLRLVSRDASTGTIIDYTNFTDVGVTVTFLEDVTAVGDFASATVLGSGTFDLGNFTVGANTNTISLTNLDFTSNGGGFNLGDGQDLGVTFAFFGDASTADGTFTTDVQDIGLISIPSRNGGGDPGSQAAVGSTDRVNFRDTNADGVIDGGFTFGNDARTRFAVSAFVVPAVPEPSSVALLGFLGVGSLVSRRRR